MWKMNFVTQYVERTFCAYRQNEEFLEKKPERLKLEHIAACCGTL
jgi:hypothetical protein